MTIAVSPRLFAQSETSSESLPKGVTFWSDYPAETLARTIVERMSDAECL